MKYHNLVAISRFRQIVDKLYVEGDKVFKESNLDFKMSWFSVYTTLADTNEAISVNEISKRCGFTHIAVKNVLRMFLNKGIIIQEIDPDDRRSKLNMLSTKGRNLELKLESTWKGLERTVRNFFMPIDPHFADNILLLNDSMDKNNIFDTFYAKEKTELTIENIVNNKENVLFEMFNTFVRNEKNRIPNADEKELYQNINDLSKIPYVIKFNNHEIGTGLLKFNTNKESEVRFIYLNPSYRNFGYSKFIINRMLSHSLSNGYTKVWVKNIKPSSNLAICLLRLGFNISKGNDLAKNDFFFVFE